MTRDAGLYIGDIRRAIAKIEKYTKGLTFEKFKNDDKTVDAVVRNLHIIGEAVKHLPKEFRNRGGNIPWREIIGMRNILVHEYFGLDAGILWKTVTEDIPTFRKQFAALLKK